MTLRGGGGGDTVVQFLIYSYGISVFSGFLLHVLFVHTGLSDITGQEKRFQASWLGMVCGNFIYLFLVTVVVLWLKWNNSGLLGCFSHGVILGNLDKCSSNSSLLPLHYPPPTMCRQFEFPNSTKVTMSVVWWSSKYPLRGKSRFSRIFQNLWFEKETRLTASPPSCCQYHTITITGMLFLVCSQDTIRSHWIMELLCNVRRLVVASHHTWAVSREAFATPKKFQLNTVQ